MKASKAEKPAKSDKSKKSEKDAKLKKSKKGDKKGVEVKAKAADAQVRSDDAVTRHLRRERIVPQRLPHGPRRTAPLGERRHPRSRRR